MTTNFGSILSIAAATLISISVAPDITAKKSSLLLPPVIEEEAKEAVEVSTPHFCSICGLEHERHMTSQEARALFESLPVDSAINEWYAAHPLPIDQPLVYKGFRQRRRVTIKAPEFKFEMNALANGYDRDRYAGILYSESEEDLELEDGDEILSIANDSTLISSQNATQQALSEPSAPVFQIIPQWLETAMRQQRIFEDIVYQYMVNNPQSVEYAYWDLPVPPTLPDEDESFQGFLQKLNLPDIDKDAAIIPKFEQRRINWLHTIGGGIQFSQAYISSNWYQGGNNYLALLFNANWDVTLNNVYHPNLMFQSNLSYKLALNSNPSDALHKYSISQDLFQYNLKMGLKAFEKWFYSFNMQFKTQLFNSYPSDSPNLGASFLSPGDFNLGLGMTYSLSKLNDRMKFSASISPISYNLKTCLSNRIDHAQFNIEADRHTASEIGSNAELNLTWDITSNISWKSRMFLFTNYKYFLADWENTFNFTINKFLSTQLYLHPRYDSSSDFNSSDWHYWSLKEILSFGLSYTFTTKP